MAPLPPRLVARLGEESTHHDPPAVPVIVPDIPKYGHYPPDAPFSDVHAQAIWSDAAAWVPQALWLGYGDQDRLRAHYPGMITHLESIEPLLSDTGLWDQGMQLADWLDPDAPPDEPWALVTDDGGIKITSDCATVYRTGDLLRTARCRGAVRGCDASRRGRPARHHLVTTGFAGTPYVTWALNEHGYADDAYRILLQSECPSWLYPVTMGATTIWERWDSMLPDGTINPGEMTSFNHYALGAFADWLYAAVAGIRATEPGFARIPSNRHQARASPWYTPPDRPAQASSASHGTR